MPFDVDYIYLFVSMFVFNIFIFKREWLFERESFNVILGISTLLFLIGIVLHFTKTGTTLASSALLTPLLSLLAFRFFRKLFFMIAEREPEDTFLRRGEELGPDRLFNITFMISIFILFAVAIFVTDSLKEIGW